jgi:hypothetical protein
MLDVSTEGNTDMADQLEIATKALESVLFGLTSPENKVWPTPQSWTKKERDQEMLTIVREALHKIRKSHAA